MATATVPCSVSSPQPQSAARAAPRRAVLGGCCASVAVATVAGPAAAAAADPHPAWWAEAEGLLAQIDGPGPLGDDRLNELLDEFDELADRIGATPARTREGALAQLRVVLHYHPERYLSPVEEWQRQALTNAIVTLERLAGES